MVQGAVPALQLRQVDLHAPVLFPTRQVAAASAVADIIGLQPLGQGMLARRTHESVGDQHQDATDPIVIRIFARQQLRPTLTGIEQWPQTQLAKEVTRDQHWPPGAGVEDFDGPFASEFLGQLLRLLLAFEKANELGQDGFQGIASAEVGDDLLLDLSVLPHRTDDADILVDGAVGGGNFDGSNEHNVIITISVKLSTVYSMIIACHPVFSCNDCHYAFSESEPPRLELRRDTRRHLLNMG